MCSFAHEVGNGLCSYAGGLVTMPELRAHSRGFTLIELLIVVAIIAILAAIAVPNLLRARMASNEASAISTMRTVVTAQANFRAISGGFADDLATLADVCPGTLFPFLGEDLGANDIVKSGYRFTNLPGLGAMPGPNDCFGNATRSSYYASGEPVSNFTGQRSFATNAASMVWQSSDATAPDEPFIEGPDMRPLGR
jgi:type IV pilus assembly protein PilA